MLSDSCNPIYATNGKEAIDILMRESVSIVLLDIMMPVMNGLEFLDYRNSDAFLKTIPVIVLTSESSMEVECLKQGASDFIKKPFNAPEVIRTRVFRIIELFEDRNLINLTSIDELSGLYTKEYFFQNSILMNDVYKDVEFDMICVNINHFSLTTELYGAEFSHNLLKEIGKAIFNYVKIINGIGSRMYNDSFAAYIPHQESYDRLISLLEETIQRIAKEISITFRIGVYTCVDKKQPIEVIFEKVENVCDSLRGTFKKIAFYDNKFHEKEIYLEHLVNDFPTALKTGQFKVFYQAKYNVAGDKDYITSSEALIRWIHPEYGLISPGDFIPLFEKNGLIQKLDKYVIEQATKKIKEWKDKYGRVFPVSVNLSRIDIYNPNLEKILAENIKKNGLEPNDLLLEITESAFMDNFEQLINVTNSLSNTGFKIELDDFGSGYSSLNILTSIPFDILKIDMQFVKNINKNEKDNSLIKFIVNIAKALDLMIVAEGVENKMQYDFLKDLGCEIIQGYLFAKPLPASEFEKLIEKELNK